MILVLASHHDQAARALVERWPVGGAVLMTCQDFLTEGWAFFPKSPEDSVAVAGGRKIRCDSVGGVLTLRPCVLEQELTGIDPRDRQYCCGEINAFLIAWLSSLPCAVLNRPTATSLSGPNWSPERWVLEAGRLGIPVEARTRSVPAAASGEAAREAESPVQHVCMLGGRALSGADPILEEWTARLAKRAGVELLETRFREGRMIWAGCWPDPSRSELSEALIEYFCHDPAMGN